MLRISKLTDYGTVILAALASQPEQRLTAAEVAERTHVGLPTVSKLLKALQRGGLVVSARGSHGGYQLARAPSQISAAAILDAIEGRIALTECSTEHLTCCIARTCRVGHAWQRVNTAIHAALNEVTLAQLAGLDRSSIRVAQLTAGIKAGAQSRVPRSHSE